MFKPLSQNINPKFLHHVIRRDNVQKIMCTKVDNTNYGKDL
jgi:hypothetical protein